MKILRTATSLGSNFTSYQRRLHVYFNEIMWLTIMKMKMKNRSHRYNKNRPRPRLERKYTEYKKYDQYDGAYIY